jgi:hypothetical protein
LVEEILVNKNRLGGAFGGGGGALALGTWVSYIIWPQRWTVELFLTLEGIGVFLVILSIVIFARK